MNIHKNINLFKYADFAQNHLIKEGVKFTPNGLPVLTNFSYPCILPEDIEVWPYNKRNQAKNPSRTIITFFESDLNLYGYINLIDKITSNLGIYYGVTGFDISPCLEFSIEEQKMALLINTLTNGIFLTNGIKVIPSLRTGNIETIDALKSYPKNVCYAFGALGCNQKHKNIGNLLTELKLALCEPSKILVYGNLSTLDKKIFNNWKIPFISYLDYQRKSREKSRERRLLNV
jgi:hypothetical protein